MESRLIDTEFSDKEDDANITLIVEGTKIPYPREVLIRASPVFKAMLTSDFEENRQHKIIFEGKQITAFMEFLRIIYPGHICTVTDQNCNEILPLAHEFQVREVTTECERVLAKRLRRSFIQGYKNRHTPSSNLSTMVFSVINISLKCGLGELETLAKKIASELTQMDRNESEESIPDAIMAEIQVMAIMRLEEDTKDNVYKHKDAGYLTKSLETGPQFLRKYNRTETSSEVHMRHIIDARRLNVFDPSPVRTALEVLRREKDHYSEENQTLYNSLPEEIKHDVENLDQECPICRKYDRCSCLKTCYLNDNVVKNEKTNFAFYNNLFF